MWTHEEAALMAARHLGSLGRRWCHVQAVGQLSDTLAGNAGLAREVGVAAWLHDLGYAPALADTGLHSLDGANYLQHLGAPDEVVSLVAWHTGAEFEACQRGLMCKLLEYRRPVAKNLDALTLLDLVTSPDGLVTTPEDRLGEILSRYAADDPVHKAVSQSQEVLLASSVRARRALSLSNIWPVGVAERM